MKAQQGSPNQSTPRDKTFFSMTAAYSLGVFNDNFFKQAVLLLAIGAGLAHLQGTATVLFALPFILCSAYAGWLADRFPKKTIVVNAKIMELLAMLLGAVGLLTANWFCIISMIFLMGLQSAIFGPSLNGSIPEHFPTGEVTRINGTLKMCTTVAILVGIACAGIALDLEPSQHGGASPGLALIACIIVLVSALGLAASLGIAKYRAAAPAKPFPWAGPLHSLVDIWSLRKDPALLLAVLSDGFFYFLAAFVVLIINTFGLHQVGLSQTVTSLLSVALMIGVALGAIFNSRAADPQQWTRVLRPGTMGMGAGLIAAAATPYLPGEYRVAALFASFVATGFCGGFFLIPVTSFIQVRPRDTDKGQVLAVAGFCSFIGILLAGQLYSLLDSRMTPGGMLVLAGLFSIAVSGAYTACFRWNSALTRSVLHRMLTRILKLRYDIRVIGLDTIRDAEHDEGILFLPNHPASADPPILMSILYPRFQPRPLADHDQTDRFYIRPFMKLVNAIRIPNLARNGRGTKEKIAAGIDTVVRSLDLGDNVILYPAGRLYRSKHERLGAKSAVHTILDHNPRQRIVLVRTTGLWGSAFSWAEGTPGLPGTWKTLVLFALANGMFFAPRRQVTVELVEPVDFPRTADRATLNRALEEFYNVGAQANTFVPYFWWQGRGPIRKPEPKDDSAPRDLAGIPESIRTQVILHLQEMNGIDSIAESDRLALDIGMDSLSLMELAVWIEQEFGMPVEDLESIRTVGDVILAACGQTVGTSKEKQETIPAGWFAGDAANKLALTPAETITQSFLQQARTNPGRAIIADRISGVKTYRQVVMAIMVLQKKLRTLANPSLGIMLPASVSASISYFATLFAGKIPVMLNWTVGSGHMQHCLNTAGLSHVITAKALVERLEGQGMDLSALDVHWIYLEDLRTQISGADKLKALVASYLPWTALTSSTVSDTAAILFTSGSEASPKAVPLSHANILANLKDFNSVLSFRESDRLLGMLPPFHSLGLAGTIIMPLCLGLKTTYYPNPTEGGTLAALVHQYRSTLLIGTPTFVNGILRAARKDQLSSLRLLFTGAEKCPEYIYRRVQEELPCAILCEGYGITECSPVVSVNSPDNPVPETIGRVLPGMEYRIVDPDTMIAAKPDSQGILLLRGANVFAGYLGGETTSPFVRHEGKVWYNTGDLVREDGNGILTFCGRLKRFIKLGGEMISLPAIEAALQQFLPPDDAGAPTLAVEATPDENHPEVVLFTTKRIDREEVNAYIRQAGLSALHNIRRLVQVEHIPVLGTGKINYRQLKIALV